jgi:hypothetical protein
MTEQQTLIYRWTSLYARDRDSKKGSNIMNSNIKRPRIVVNLRIGSRKMAISQLYICEIADKKVAYNEGLLYYKVVEGEIHIFFANFISIVYVHFFRTMKR